MTSRLIQARFDGKCRNCGKAVRKGENVYFAKHYGVRCEACGPHTADDAPLPSKRSSKTRNPAPEPKQDAPRKKRRTSGDTVPFTPDARFAPDYTPANARTRLPADMGPDRVHRMMFESISDVVEDAFSNYSVGSADSVTTLASLHNSQAGTSWANGHTKESLRNALVNPKAELVQAIEEMRTQIIEDLDLPATPRRRMRRGQDWGDEMDADRFLARDPQCWSRMVREQQNSRTVAIGVNLTVHWRQNPNELLYRGAAACALADVLTGRGINVRILGFSVGSSCSSAAHKLVTTVQLKASDMPLDMASLATALCDIGFYRMAVLFAEARHLPGTVSGCLGMRGEQYLPGPDRMALDYLVESRVTNRQAAIDWLKEQMTTTAKPEVCCA